LLQRPYTCLLPWLLAALLLALLLPANPAPADDTHGKVLRVGVRSAHRSPSLLEKLLSPGGEMGTTARLMHMLEPIMGWR